MKNTAFQQPELSIFVRQVGEHYQFTEKEKHEAFAAACADPDDALTVFRGMAKEFAGGGHND